MAITPAEIAETRGMVAEQHLDIRTVTMGISLMGCADEDLGRMCTKVYDRITKTAHIPVHVDSDPLTTVLRGAGITLDDPEKYRDLLIEC